MEFVIKDGVLEEYNGNSEEVYIPGEVIKIGTVCFGCNNKIRTVYITGNTKIIAVGAFQYCCNLQMVCINSELEIIEASAFEGCKNLMSIDMPDSIKKIGFNVFCGCENLQYIHIPKNIKVIEAETFAYCKTIGNVIIPEGVEVIEEFAFGECVNLKNVSFPDSLINIDENAFFNCHRLNANESYRCYFSIFESLTNLKKAGLTKTAKALKKLKVNDDIMKYIMEDIISDAIVSFSHYNELVYAYYLVNRQFEIEDDEFVLKCPKSLDELLEGVINSLILYMLDSILDGDFEILCLRKRDSLDETIATVLIDDTGKIVDIIKCL